MSLKKNRFTKNDNLLIKVSKVYLFPLYVLALFLRFYDGLKLKLKNIIDYKILKKKKEVKIEDWWV
ncbi:MAG: hypothetical protein Q4A58_00600 [Fusobacterium sp.]|uniref:hypothetical protein n=1 Tax=Fusobacterium sp. TaxID=68766 RepID=UPI0026DBAF1D|nr:hypothetical protein [Fusobacterium sp.]MDO4689788.1 hypothetical protein [Fusobacterium sp.]